MRVGVYIDGFNVYYGARSRFGRGTAGWRWLDLAALSSSLIDPVRWPGARLDRLVYCTAPRDSAGDPTSLADQRTYIQALQHGPVAATVIYGRFVPRTKHGDLADRRGYRVPSPGRAALPGWLPAREVIGPAGTPVLRTAVATFEEKGSDVNVASRLLIDVLEYAVDAAIVLTNDSDLGYPLAEARRRVPVGTVNPGLGPTPGALQGNGAEGAGRHWWRRLAAADYTSNQYPAVVGTARRPRGWLAQAKAQRGF